ncbi:21701_t:CDS:2 [Cetraspora pellucida]|uniref:21701_t:CDS:1 n=1 Tax=Cetraspora pellucida TaxID=1433469 RepID=A0A9N8WR47_9GLOM|nr:21701_t:CDS:2 [Cetraspora pellucida]
MEYLYDLQEPCNQFQNIQYYEVLDSIHFSYIQDFKPRDDVGNYDVQEPSDDVGNYNVQEPSGNVDNYDIQDPCNHVLNTLSSKNNEEVYNEIADLCEDDKLANESLEIKLGLSFPDWQSFKIWLYQFALQEGFNYKIRTSEKDGEIVRQANYICAKSGTYNSNATADPIKRHNNKLNVTFPKSTSAVKINSVNNVHNYLLTPMIKEIAPQFRKLTPEMLSDIEKYIVQGRMNSESIYPLLRHDYPEQSLYKCDLYNAIYAFRRKNNPGDSDALLMLQTLLN